MSDIAIEVQNLSKLYKLGTIGSHSLRQDLYRWWQKSILKKEVDYGTSQVDAPESKQQFIWALNDVNLQLKEGEALGIIGSNGSGKSTLLKIISRVINPTKGVVRGKGKISSILEVGTGFNPELTGRQNIFISGYLLGMNKYEVLSKFDEIVAFSGVEKFIDTPVKRYSSGMYMRLAFSVAAHLEPDILIVDEVLAVGDIDFQKKCMGKMQEVSNTKGRTILFVSHNMQAVSNLCSTALWLEKGVLKKIGNSKEIVQQYIGSDKKSTTTHDWQEVDSAPGNDIVRLKKIGIRSENKDDNYLTVHSPIIIDAEFWFFEEGYNINVNVELYTQVGECVFNLGSVSARAEKSIIALQTVIPGNLLNNSSYLISLTVVKNFSIHLNRFSNCISFDVEDVREGIPYFGEWPGIIRPKVESLLYKKQTL